MMMTQVVNQKRRHYDRYLPCTTTTMATSTNTIDVDYTTINSKRIKSSSTPTPTGDNTLSPKEKKDKIGERVAALQQLVSPFGKSDTASVLQEASGYIKFLHDQLQVLSAPYLRSSVAGNIEDPEYYSLSNRGLCLVPVNLTAGIARTNGADLWAPINSKARSTSQ